MSSMPAILKTIGGERLPVPGFGAMGLSHGYGERKSDEEGKRVLRKAIELGYRIIDTADIYGPATNEELVGQVLADPGMREKVFVCTKFGFKWSRQDRKAVPGEVDGRPEYVKSSCEESLKRLGVDVIDLYYQHRVDNETPIEDTVKAMEELRKEGKIRYLGLSECSANTLRRACKVAQIHAVQIEFSAFCLDPLYNGMMEACRELGVAIVAFSPLGRGFLTGAIKSPDDFVEGDMRMSLPRFSKEHFGANLELVAKFKELAAKKGCSAGQLCLAWLMAQEGDIIPIPGTTSLSNLEENWRSVDVSVSEEDDKAIKEILAEFKPSGDRYPPLTMKLIGR